MAKTSKQHTGALGETIAQKWLEQQGYHILAANWRYQKCEIDLIAQLAETLVFVEVKTRTGPHHLPEAAVQAAKMAKMAEAAEAYLEMYPSNCPIRFDIIAVQILGAQNQITHFPDAFFPTE